MLRFPRFAIVLENGASSEKLREDGRILFRPGEKRQRSSNLLMKFEFAHCVRIKVSTSMGFRLTRQQSAAKKPNRPVSQKWA